MSADFRQQQELEEFEQYIAEQIKWFDEQLNKFNEIFGVKNERTQETDGSEIEVTEHEIKKVR